ncbi:(2Fe-2S)-binding protein [Pacificimonas sp. ICDLI1SI03]
MRIGEQAERGAAISVEVNGTDLPGFAGESLAALMLAAGITHFRTSRGGTPRAPFCNMGTCGECYVRVDGRQRRACLVPAAEGMKVCTDD